ncbi:zinc ribbon domain-containing protein [Faecalicatena contorta]|uniref:zinc ribbon domain-containing protein n=1 Tax=Faecalicatena contorta TaxID=39482 RepID=UPI001F21ED2E|nr:zinc-ribbon domain-containing protein [Faecalicatena contorta]MCF2683717.1 zinc-ribbon domain-containing protein [Faecalicatena contorta]
MAYCVKCGYKAEDGTRFCPKCGAEIPVQAAQGGDQQENTQEYTYTQNTYEQNTYGQAQEEYFPQEEVRQNKGMGILSYFGFLVLIPLLAGNKNSEYVKQHLNQGISLWVISAILDLLDGEAVFGLYSFTDFGNNILSRVLDVAGFAIFIIVIMGIVSACKGTKKPLPLVGNIKIFK